MESCRVKVWDVRIGRTGGCIKTIKLLVKLVRDLTRPGPPKGSVLEGWKTILFLLGKPILRSELLVLGNVFPGMT